MSLLAAFPFFRSLVPPSASYTTVEWMHLDSSCTVTIYTSAFRAVGLHTLTHSHTCTSLSQTLMRDLANVDGTLWTECLYCFYVNAKVEGRCYWRGVMMCFQKNHKNIKHCVLTSTELSWHSGGCFLFSVMHYKSWTHIKSLIEQEHTACTGAL